MFFTERIFYIVRNKMLPRSPLIAIPEKMKGYWCQKNSFNKNVKKKLDANVRLNFTRSLILNLLDKRWINFNNVYIAFDIFDNSEA